MRFVLTSDFRANRSEVGRRIAYVLSRLPVVAQTSETGPRWAKPLVALRAGPSGELARGKPVARRLGPGQRVHPREAHCAPPGCGVASRCGSEASARWVTQGVSHRWLGHGLELKSPRGMRAQWASPKIGHCGLHPPRATGRHVSGSAVPLLSGRLLVLTAGVGAAGRLLAW